MGGRLFVSYASADAELAGHLRDFLQAALRPEWIATTEHDPRVSQSGVDPVRQADAVLGVLSRASIASGQVPFALGSAYSLSKPVFVLVTPDVNPEHLSMPCHGSGPFKLDGLGSLATMARELATLLGTEFEMTEAATDSLDRMMPPEEPEPGVPAALGDEEDDDEVDDDASTLVGRPAPVMIEPERKTPPDGLAKPSDESRALPPPPAGIDVTTPAGPRAAGPAEPQDAASEANDELEEDMQSAGEAVDLEGGGPGSARPSQFPSALPSCAASLEAGRAFSECVFNREENNDFASELDAPFGSFIAALGGNWNQLREIGDIEVWMEAADNVLSSLSDGEEHVRSWYDVGFCLATLTNVIGFDAPDDDPERAELLEVAGESLEGFREAAAEVGFEESEVEELAIRFQNLLGPQPARDYTNMGRIQEMIRERAARADGMSLP